MEVCMKIASRLAVLVLAVTAASPAAWAMEPDNVYRAWENYRQHYDGSGHMITPGATGATASRPESQAANPSAVSSRSRPAAGAATAPEELPACLQGPPACTAAGYANFHY